MPPEPQALSGVRVLELGGPLGHYCGRLLADLGADVVKIEPPAGDAVRRRGPFAGDRPDPEGSLPFYYFNANKRSLVLDLESVHGREKFLDLVRSADAVVESFPAGYLPGIGLGYDALRRVRSDLVLTSITGFGQTGPYASFRSNDLIASAMGGLLYMSGDPDAAPVVPPCDEAEELADAHAAYATLVALYNRRATGAGAHLDVSLQETVASLYFTIVRYGMKAEIVRRIGSSVPARWCGIYPTRDGWASVYVGPTPHFRAFMEWAGHPDEISGPEWEDPQYRTAHYQVMDEHFRRLTLARTTEEVARQGQEYHIPVGPVYTTGQFLDHAHTRARGFRMQVEHPTAGRLPFPGATYRFAASPWRLSRPAPLLGQHTEEVLAELAPSPAPRAGETPALPGRPPTPPAPCTLHPEPPTSSPSPSTPSPPPSTLHPPPFSRIRILDFSRVWAGPFGTRYLGDLGAEVIRVESAVFLDQRSAPGTDPQRRYEQTCLFQEVNRSKLSITLNLHDARARDLVRRLVRVVDVVTENFSPRVMKRWDLDYAHLRRQRHDLIMVSQPGFGASGPLRDFVAYGSTLTAFVGISSLWCHPGAPGEVWGHLSHLDFVAAAHAATAVTAALHHRAHTGEGQHVEVAMAEAAAATMGVAYLDYLVNGRVWQPAGNRSPHWPQNLFRCRGHDRWCAIAITSDGEWERFRAALGEPTWTADPRFATNTARLTHQDDLDRRIGEWTSEYTPHQVMWLLQRAGVPAGAVQTGEDLYYDHHLRQRGFITQVDHPETGPATHAGIVPNVMGSSRQVRRRAPLLGEHNEYVFGDLLGLSRTAVEELVEAEVLL